MLKGRLSVSSEVLHPSRVASVSLVWPTSELLSSHISGMHLPVCWQAVLSESSRDGQDGVWPGQWEFGRPFDY